MRKIIALIAVLAMLFVAGCSSPENANLDNQANLDIDGAVATETGTQITEEQDAKLSGNVVEIEVEAFKWGFDLTPYKIKAGDKVRMTITSRDGTHGVTIPAFGIQTRAISPGGEEVVEFVATEAGEYEMLCNVPCGLGHSTMRTEIIVE